MTRFLRGWPLVACVALAVAALFCVTLSALGFDEQSVRVLVRATARSSFVLFVCAFAGPALEAFPRASRAGRWARDNFRHLLVSLAVSHTAHALALAALARVTGGEAFRGRDLSGVVGGGLAYALIYAMAALPFTRAGVGARRFVGVFGMYYVWIVFMSSYGGRAFRSPAYVPFALALVAALGLRLYASLRRGRDLAAAEV